MKTICIIAFFLVHLSVNAQKFHYFDMDTTRSTYFTVLKTKNNPIKGTKRTTVPWYFTRDRELILMLDSISRSVFFPTMQTKAPLLKKLGIYAFFNKSLYLSYFEFIIPKKDPDVRLSDVLSMEKELLNFTNALKKVSVKDYGYTEKPEEFGIGTVRFNVLRNCKRGE